MHHTAQKNQGDVTGIEEMDMSENDQATRADSSSTWGVTCPPRENQEKKCMYLAHSIYTKCICIFTTL